jgi:putative ABC transport system permease protein
MKKSIRHIALKNLRYQRFRTLILFILLTVTTIGLFFSSFLTESMSEGIIRTEQRIGADIIVVPDTYVSSIEDALFLGKPCTVNFEKDWMKKLNSVDGIKKVSSQLYLSSLGSDCCDATIQLIAFDKNTDFTITPWLSKNAVSKLSNNEIIIGSNIKKHIGDTITFFGRKFTVADVMDESGMGYDSCAFITYESDYEIAKDPLYKNILPFKGDERISMVLLDVKQGYELSEVKKEIIDKYGKEDIAVFTTSELLTNFSNNLKNIKVYGTLFKILFIILAVSSLYAIFTLSIYLRRREFGSMLSIGITKRKIRQMLIWEMFYIALLASVTGIGVVCAITIPFHMQIKNILNIPYLLPEPKVVMTLMIKVLAVNFVVCALASVHSLIKLGKTEAAHLVKEENG